MKTKIFTFTSLIFLIGIYVSSALGVNTAEAYIAEQCYLEAILPDEPNEETKYDCTPEGSKDKECDSTEGKCG